MSLSDIPDVSALHIRTLPTATARLGVRVLSHFYSTLLTHSYLHHALVAVSGKTVIGAITATRDAKKTQMLLADPTLFFPILAAIVRRRVSIAELLRRAVTEKNIMAIQNPYQTILTLVVDTSEQRKGVGKKLLVHLEQKLQQNLYVDTEAANTAARTFYERCGFRFIKTIHTSVIAVKTLIPAPK